MQTLNKRAVFYTLLQHIQSTNQLDDLLCDACFLLQLNRSNIGVQASAKGLLSGQITLSQDIDYMQIPAKFSHKLDPSIFDKITTVIVVEKDTVFQRLIQMPILQKPYILCVTAKGYPDFATRKFLLLLCQAGKKLYYIGDADPYGAEIYFCYVFGSSKFAICEQKLVSERLELQWIGPFMQDFTPDELLQMTQIKLNQNDRLKAYSLLSKPFLQEKVLMMDGMARKQFAFYKEHIRLMVEQDCKFEVEAIYQSGNMKVDLLQTLIELKLKIN